VLHALNLRQPRSILNVFRAAASCATFGVWWTITASRISNIERVSRFLNRRLPREIAWEALMFTLEELATIPLFSTLGEKELEYLAGAVEDCTAASCHSHPSSRSRLLEFAC
jgi:hypothetical protein